MKFNTIIQLRRDNDFNYAKIKDKFIPANGEICLVDTARSGLRAVCGDGITPFGQLEYVNNIYVKGYLKNNVFYKDNTYMTPIDENVNLLYIDIISNALYYFNGYNYEEITRSQMGTATNTVPGIMKLYSTLGSNTDGTMTQKAITDELNDKVEVTLNIDEELIIFSND